MDWVCQSYGKMNQANVYNQGSPWLVDVFITFYSFKSHINVNEALQDFAHLKIRAVKEEIGTSHVS